MLIRRPTEIVKIMEATREEMDRMYEDRIQRAQELLRRLHLLEAELLLSREHFNEHI